MTTQNNSQFYYTSPHITGYLSTTNTRNEVIGTLCTTAFSLGTVRVPYSYMVAPGSMYYHSTTIYYKKKRQKKDKKIKKAQNHTPYTTRQKRLNQDKND